MNVEIVLDSASELFPEKKLIIILVHTVSLSQTYENISLEKQYAVSKDRRKQWTFHSFNRLSIMKRGNHMFFQISQVTLLEIIDPLTLKHLVS